MCGAILGTVVYEGWAAELGAVQASGMPALSTERYPFRDLHPHILTLVEAFGPRRTFWGTDLTRMPCTY